MNAPPPLPEILTPDVLNLSTREREVFEMIGACCSQKEIAAALGISLKTVKVHRCVIGAKLRIDRMSLIVRYVAIRDAIGGGCSS